MAKLYEKPKVLYLCDGQVEGCRKMLMDQVAETYMQDVGRIEDLP